MTRKAKILRSLRLTGAEIVAMAVALAALLSMVVYEQCRRSCDAAATEALMHAERLADSIIASAPADTVAPPPRKVRKKSLNNKKAPTTPPHRNHLDEPV